jgi:hypothetical protein
MQWQSTVNRINPDGSGRLSNAGKNGLSMQEKALLRNDDDYDDWEVGMEPIPGDTSWTHSACEKRP